MRIRYRIFLAQGMDYCTGEPRMVGKNGNPRGVGSIYSMTFACTIADGKEPEFQGHLNFAYGLSHLFVDPLASLHLKSDASFCQITFSVIVIPS
jgi:hypothetical protein